MAEDRSPIKCDLVGTHEFDPNGDVILVFSSKHIIVSCSSKFDLVNAEEWNSMVEDRAKARNEAIANAEGGQESAQEQENGQEGEQEQPHIKKEKIYELGTADIEIRVSSRHLSLLSPYFRTLLSKNFAEGKALHGSGHAKIVLEEDPAHGAKIVLGLLHLDCRVPKMTPSLLMQMAILIDKWDLSSKLSFWARDMWKSIKSHAPHAWDPDLISYLTMLHMLGLEDEMVDKIRSHIKYLTESISCDHYATQRIMDRFMQYRIVVLGRTFSSISRLIQKYCPRSQSTKPLCKAGFTSCDSIILGTLIRELTFRRLYPIPAEPYDGVSISILRSALEDIAVKSCSHKHSESNSKKHKEDILSTVYGCSKALQPVFTKMVKLQNSQLPTLALLQKDKANRAEATA